MDYAEGLNLSIAYIEDNLLEGIDFERAARIAGMSRSAYQRFFLLIANMTLDEYIRKRKLQYALRELTDTDHRVIDIAMKYGYNSATAFSVQCAVLLGLHQVKSEKKVPAYAFLN